MHDPRMGERIEDEMQRLTAERRAGVYRRRSPSVKASLLKLAILIAIGVVAYFWVKSNYG